MKKSIEPPVAPPVWAELIVAAGRLAGAGKLKGGTYTVEDALGAFVSSGRLESAGLHRLAVGDLPNGVYSVIAFT